MRSFSDQDKNCRNSRNVSYQAHQGKCYLPHNAIIGYTILKQDMFDFITKIRSRSEDEWTED